MHNLSCGFFIQLLCLENVIAKATMKECHKYYASFENAISIIVQMNKSHHQKHLAESDDHGRKGICG